MKFIYIFFIFLFSVVNGYTFSVNPGRFNVVCNAGNKVMLQYELKCTKDTPENINISYKNISGYLSDGRVILPKFPIKLIPNEEAKKVVIQIRTPITNYPENILKISFFDIPTEKNVITISSRISTRAYIRYKDKARVSFKTVNMNFSKKYSRKKLIRYFNLQIVNNGNTYIRPNGYVVFIPANKKNKKYQFIINQFEFPVYANKSRNLITEIKEFPKKGIYKMKLLINTQISKQKKINYRVKIYNDGNIEVIK